jgi:hypothetical protein
MTVDGTETDFTYDDWGRMIARAMTLAAVLAVASLLLLIIPGTRKQEPFLALACCGVFASLWIEKGLGLVITGFVPSPLEMVTDYTPTGPEIAITIGVWAMGLRNPFRVAWKPGTGSTDPALGNPGTYYIGDVGWNDWEDLHVCSAPAQNFGWPLYEGLEPQPGYQNANEPNRDAPNPLVGGSCAAFFKFTDLIVAPTTGALPGAVLSTWDLSVLRPLVRVMTSALSWGRRLDCRSATTAIRTGRRILGLLICWYDTASQCGSTKNASAAINARATAARTPPHASMGRSRRQRMAVPIESAGPCKNTP